MPDAALLTLLRSVDTPTVCDAIEIVQGKRGFAGYTHGQVFATAPDAPPMVGYACTAKLASRHPSTESAVVVREKRRNYYRHVAAAAKPSVMVVQDLDYPNCAGAFWGEVNAHIHKGLGHAGVVTNGVVRDINALPDGFPILAGSAGPSHAYVHVTGIGLPVVVFGLSVSEGDLIHADRHGAAVIPPEVLGGLAAAIADLGAAEKIVIDAARADNFDLARLEDAWARFEAARPTR
jgi:regulator of RNase E activity RraA